MKITHIILIIYHVFSFANIYAEDNANKWIKLLEDVLEEDNRRNIEKAFESVERAQEKGELDQAERIEISLFLYQHRNDPRSEKRLSEDEVSSSVSGLVLGLMSNLTGYTDRLDRQHNQDSKDPFRLNPMNFFVKEDFLDWFEEHYLKDQPNRDEASKKAEKPDDLKK